MTKRDMKKALGATLKAEESAVKHRFENAKSVQKQNETEPELETKEDASRESSNLPEVVSRIKRRCLEAGTNVTESEVIRVAVAALDDMDDDELARAFGSPRRIRTDRPRRIFVTLYANAVKYPKPATTKDLQVARRVMTAGKIVTIRLSGPVG